MTAPLYFDDLAEVETLVRDVWQKVLLKNHVDLDADFYDLGGSSIIAIRLMGCMNARGLDVTLSDILHYRTIRGLSSHVYALMKRNRLLSSWPDVAEHLSRSFPPSKFSLRIYRVVEDEGPPKDLIVICYDELRFSEEELLATLSEKVSKDFFPHYLLRATEAGEGVIQTTSEGLRNLLGLRSVRELRAELRDEVKKDYRSNDLRLKKSEVLREYPLSPIQELQFSFETPPSLGGFAIDRYLDVRIFGKAFLQLVQAQGLLRSVPVKRNGRHLWQEFRVDDEYTITPSILDLSKYQLSDEELTTVASDLVETLRFAGSRVLYHVIVVKRNAREHFVVLAFHHILFDRVSDEVVKRELLRRYSDLVAGKEYKPDVGSMFYDYVQQLGQGPCDISAPEVIAQYQLVDFFASKRRLLDSDRLKKINRSYSFQLAAPCANHRENGCSLGAALAYYVKGIEAVFSFAQVPILFIYDGRKYRGQDYYNIIGEFIDYVPMLLHAQMTPEEMQNFVAARLATINRCNLNFLSMINGRDLAEDWSEIGRLIDPGKSYRSIDVCMFNFLGNQAENDSYRASYSEEVLVTGNPLPMHSFLNCIVSSHFDGFVFNIRSSYEPQVERLRRAFRDLAGDFAVSQPERLSPQGIGPT